MLHSATFFETLGKLAAQYFSAALPFFLAHLVLAYSVFRSIRTILSEKRDLDGWTPGRPSRGVCAEILDEFVAEVRESGGKGVTTPMTDFSDRLDAHVNGLTEGLHNRINLFVAIGIAGTFFAMFQFAQGADPRDARSLSSLLQGSLANAFPVGFAGLVWTVIAHFVAQHYDDKLHNSVSKATVRAMKVRAEAVTGLAQHIQKALSEELAPLRNFDQTLSQRLQPIIEQFRDQLADSSRLLERQLTPLGAAVTSLEASAHTLGSAMERLSASADRLPTALGEVQMLQHRSMELVGRLETSFDGTSGRIEAAAGALDLAARGLAELPGQLQNSFQAELASLTGRLAIEWQRTGERFVEGVQKHHFETLTNVREEGAKSAKALGVASQAMLTAAQNIEILLQRGLRSVVQEAVQQIEPSLLDLREGLAVHVPALKEHLEQAAQWAGKTQEQAHLTLLHFEATAATLEETRRRWLPIAQKLERAADSLQAPALRPLQDVLTRTAEDVRGILERLTPPPRTAVKSRTAAKPRGVMARVKGWFRSEKQA